MRCSELRKAYDRVRMKVLSKGSISNISGIKDIYERAVTSMRTVGRDAKRFPLTLVYTKDLP